MGTRIFRAMQRLILMILLATGALHAHGQGVLSDTTAAILYTRSIGVPLNAYQLYDKAMDTWTWTFGKEPGATLRRTDRGSGLIEGTARVNFRSAMLTGREESMGVISYRVMIQLHPGGSRITVSDLNHTGNKTAQRGGIHLGRLTTGTVPPQRVQGLGRSNVERLYAEVKAVANERIQALMQAFEARLRANAEP
jgi:hypothetical protein